MNDAIGSDLLAFHWRQSYLIFFFAILPDNLFILGGNGLLLSIYVALMKQKEEWTFFFLCLLVAYVVNGIQLSQIELRSGSTPCLSVIVSPAYHSHI